MPKPPDPTAKAYELVNFIGNRAGLGDLEPGLDKLTFRERVMDERRFELAFEGNRCYDLRRWNLLHTDIAEAKGQGLSARADGVLSDSVRRVRSEPESLTF